MTTNPRAVLAATLVNSLRSGLWHRFTSRMLSFANSFTGLTTVSTASILPSLPLSTPDQINTRTTVQLPPSHLVAKSICLLFLFLADRPPGTRRWIKNPRSDKCLHPRPADLESCKERHAQSDLQTDEDAIIQLSARAAEGSDGQQQKTRRCELRRGGRGLPCSAA
ncbi:hypothetical protein Mapa_016519 [Marchantia paleacea]|nr:hypothetical protein Mapa_016519 [Marchantia paleacea]